MTAGRTRRGGRWAGRARALAATTALDFELRAPASTAVGPAAVRFERVE
jgi:hypothetical protein